MTSGVTLVLRALGVGDLLTAVPALRGLRQARPGDRIVLAAPAPLRPLVSLIDAVDELLPTPALGALREHSAIGAVPRPDLAVNLHGRGPQSIDDLLSTRPQQIVTHSHPECGHASGPPWRDDIHEVSRWCALLDLHGIPADPGDLALDAPAEPSSAPGAVVIHPGAASRARRWPPARFASLARVLVDDVGPDTRVLVTGSETERGLVTEVVGRAGLGPDAAFVGHDLAELAALVAGAALVVCGDTGVAHLATAFGTPSVVLFGPTPPSLWGPPADRGRHRALWAGTVGDPHARTPDAGLLRLTVPAVAEAARAVLPVLLGGSECQDKQNGSTTSTTTPPLTARAAPAETPGAGSRSVSSAPATSG